MTGRAKRLVGRGIRIWAPRRSSLLGHPGRRFSPPARSIAPSQPSRTNDAPATHQSRTSSLFHAGAWILSRKAKGWCLYSHFRRRRPTRVRETPDRDRTKPGQRLDKSRTLTGQAPDNCRTKTEQEPNTDRTNTEQNAAGSPTPLCVADHEKTYLFGLAPVTLRVKTRLPT